MKITSGTVITSGIIAGGSMIMLGCILAWANAGDEIAIRLAVWGLITTWASIFIGWGMMSSRSVMCWFGAHDWEYPFQFATVRKCRHCGTMECKV